MDCETDFNRYAGDLEIQIQGGPAINIPNDVLAVPNEYIDTSGAVQHNDSAADFLFSPVDGANLNDQLIIGKQFFSGAYLTVNVDNQTWSIWSANSTTDTKLTAIGEECEEVTNTTTAAEPHVPVSQTDSANSDVLSHGAIAGIAAGGGCVVVILVGIVAFFAIKKRRAKRARAAKLATAQQGRRVSPDQYWPDGSRHMIDGREAVQEMAGSQTVPYELGSEEKPVELAYNGWRSIRGSSRYHVVELPASRY